MKRAPAFPPKAFYRIKFSNDSSVLEHETQRLEDMIDERSISMVSADNARRFKFNRGNGFVVASWDKWDESARAKVKALGVVIEINATEQPVVMWVHVQCELPRLDSGGAEHWDKTIFQFKGNVPKDFGLAELFAKHMTDLFAVSRGTIP